MTTIAKVYNPLIEAALNNDTNGYKLLEDLGAELFRRWPDKCHSVKEGIEQARVNLDYYSQYFSEHTANKVKTFYNLGLDFRGLDGNKYHIEG